jgi:hypothetical protein
MAVAVVVVPGALVLVRSVVGNEPLEDALHVVLDQTRFELERRQRDRAARDEQMHDAVTLLLANALRELGVEVDDVGITVRGEFKNETLRHVQQLPLRAVGALVEHARHARASAAPPRILGDLIEPCRGIRRDYNPHPHRSANARGEGPAGTGSHASEPCEFPLPRVSRRTHLIATRRLF